MFSKSAFGVLTLISALVLSSCSGSSVRSSGVLPQSTQTESVLQPATTSNVKITEYPVLRGPQNPAIGPDGAVWFGAAGPNSTGPIFVYRFAANDGQGRFYALSSLLRSNDLLTGVWAQVGPLVSFAGRMWIPFQAQPQDWADLDDQGGLIQMTAGGTAVSAGVIKLWGGGLEVGGAAVEGNRLWLLPTRYETQGVSRILSFTFQNGSLHLESLLDMPVKAILGNALRIGPDGNIYALTSGDLVASAAFFTGVLKVSPSAKLLAMYQLNNFSPIDMAFGSDGAMWITNAGPSQIIRMTTNGTRALYTIRYSGSRPTSITLGHDGAMWFVDAGTNAIGRLTTSGGVTEYPVPTRNAFVNGGGIVACPIGVAACGSGDIWFTESNTSKLGRIHF